MGSLSALSWLVLCSFCGFVCSNDFVVSQLNAPWYLNTSKNIDIFGQSIGSIPFSVETILGDVLESRTILMEDYPFGSFESSQTVRIEVKTEWRFVQGWSEEEGIEARLRINETFTSEVFLISPRSIYLEVYSPFPEETFYQHNPIQVILGLSPSLPCRIEIRQEKGSFSRDYYFEEGTVDGSFIEIKDYPKSSFYTFEVIPIHSLAYKNTSASVRLYIEGVDDSIIVGIIAGICSGYVLYCMLPIIAGLFCWRKIRKIKKRKLKDEEDLELEKVNWIYDVFFSFSSENGCDLAVSVKLQLLQIRPNLRIFLDFKRKEESKREEAMSFSKNYLLFITEGVLHDCHVQEELKCAVSLKRNVVLVHDEKNCSFPSGKSLEGLPEEIRSVLQNKAIPYYREKEFRGTSIQKIIQSLK